MPTILRSALQNALWLLLGGLAGVLNILMLWWAVRRMRPAAGSGNAARMHAWRGYVFRFAVVTALLVWVARQGAGPLLWAFVGFMASRWATIPWLSHRSVSIPEEI